jgi:excisionase family DNA binding protein
MQNDRMFLMPFSPEEFQSLIREVIKEELSIASSMKNEKLMNANQLCEFLGIHISTLNTWKAEGKIPFKRLGKRIFFDRKEVLSSLKEAGTYKKMNELK